MTQYEITSVSYKKKGRGINIILTALISIVLGILIYVYYSSPSEKTAPESTQETIITEDNYVFNDGLNQPNTTIEYQLNEFGEGISNAEIFSVDINGDNRKDRISRRLYENGTAHFYYNYKIELNTGNGYMDITPDDFRTTEGAECALQKLKFVFIPQFTVIKISRPWNESWTTPTNATKTIYTLVDNELKLTQTIQMGSVCNVSDLF